MLLIVLLRLVKGVCKLVSFLGLKGGFMVTLTSVSPLLKKYSGNRVGRSDWGCQRDLGLIGGIYPGSYARVGIIHTGKRLA